MNKRDIICAQRRMAVDLNSFESEIKALKNLQAETAAELEALLPANFSIFAWLRR